MTGQFVRPMMQHMASLSDVFGTWESIPEMAADIGESQWTVAKWKERKRIPNTHWPSLLAALQRKGKKLSADDLLAMHFSKSQRRSPERIRA